MPSQPSAGTAVNTRVNAPVVVLVAVATKLTTVRPMLFASPDWIVAQAGTVPDAAGTLGASRGWVFLTITLPLILPGIVAGGILAFARSLGEFGATITFVSNIPGETQTLPSAIYTFTQVPGGDAGAIRLSLVAIAISALALLTSEFLARAVGRRVTSP